MKLWEQVEKTNNQRIISGKRLLFWDSSPQFCFLFSWFVSVSPYVHNLCREICTIIVNSFETNHFFTSSLWNILLTPLWQRDRRFGAIKWCYYWLKLKLIHKWKNKTNTAGKTELKLDGVYRSTVSAASQLLSWRNHLSFCLTVCNSVFVFLANHRAPAYDMFKICCLLWIGWIYLNTVIT